MSDDSNGKSAGSARFGVTVNGGYVQGVAVGEDVRQVNTFTAPDLTALTTALDTLIKHLEQYGASSLSVQATQEARTQVQKGQFDLVRTLATGGLTMMGLTADSLAIREGWDIIQASVQSVAQALGLG
jgi:hypothetical protein